MTQGSNVDINNVDAITSIFLNIDIHNRYNNVDIHNVDIHNVDIHNFDIYNFDIHNVDIRNVDIP